MDINRAVTNQLQPIGQLKEAALSLKVNQAMVVKIAAADVTQNTLTLQWGDKTLHVTANPTLTPAKNPLIGVTLTLQVTKLIPTPEFQIINTDTALKAPTATLRLSLIPLQINQETNTNPSPLNLIPPENQREIIATNLLQLLPQHLSPTLLLTQLLRDLPTLQQNSALSADLKRILQTLLQALPEAQQLFNPQKLEQTVQDSGLLLEAKLLQILNGVPTDLQQDFKATLLKVMSVLAQQLRSSSNEATLPQEQLTLLSELHQKTAGAVALLVLDQLASLPKENSSTQIWHVEIPFITPQGADSLTLEIECDTRGTAETGQSPDWSVTLTLTPPSLGTLYCKISSIDNTLNTYFRSEEDRTLALVGQNIVRLRSQLEDASLKPGHIDLQRGHLRKKVSQKLTSKNLFEDKA